MRVALRFGLRLGLLLAFGSIAGVTLGGRQFPNEPANPVRIDGVVIVEGGGLLPPFALSFTPYKDGETVSVAIKDRSGSFTAELPEGEYHVTWFALPIGYSLQSIRSGEDDVLARPLKIPRDADRRLTVTLGVSSPPPWVRVRGRVVGSNPGEWRTPRKLSLRREAIGRRPWDPRLELLPDVPTPIPVPDVDIAADGTFEFPRVLPGPYRATVADVPLLAPQPFLVSPKSSAVLDVAFPAIRSIAVRILTDDGAPVEPINFDIKSVDELYANQSPVLGQDGTLELTVPDGEFQIDLHAWQVPFKYFVKELSAGSTDLRKERIRVSSSTGEIHLRFGMISAFKVSGVVKDWVKVAAFFPLVRDWDVFERSGNSRRTEELYRVPGAEFAHMEIGFGVDESRRGAKILSALIAPDGSFEFPAVPPGEHTVQFGSRPPLPGDPPSRKVKVRKGDITGVRIPAPRMKTIAGRVSINRGRPIPLLHLRVADGDSGVIEIVPAADGSFSFQMPSTPPTRPIGIANGTLPPGYRLFSSVPLLLDLNDPFALDLSAAADSSHRIAGTVSGLDNRPAGGQGSAPKITVKLTAEAAGPRYVAAGSSRSSTVAADGSFEFLATLPGMYTVQIVDRSGIAATLPVTVADKDVTGLRLAIPAAK